MPSTTIISTAACSDGFRAGSRSAAALPAALLHLAHIPGLGAVRLNRLLQAFGSAEAVLEAGSAGLTGIVPARLEYARIAADDFTAFPAGNAAEGRIDVKNIASGISQRDAVMGIAECRGMQLELFFGC